jgi:malate synthase
MMEDAATAEICRAQLWQWLRFEAPLDDGRRFTTALFEALFEEEMSALLKIPNIVRASRLFRAMVTADRFEEFLTLPAYPLLG